MKRSKAMDRALCLHEAAHAVASEVFRPGSVIGIEMDYVAGTPCLAGIVYADDDDVQAVCSWNIWPWIDPDMMVAVAAGRYGEEIEPNPTDCYWAGDEQLLRHWCPSRLRRKVRRRAQALVRDHELEIRRVARVLATKRILTGEEIREAAWLPVVKADR